MALDLKLLRLVIWGDEIVHHISTKAVKDGRPIPVSLEAALHDIDAMDILHDFTDHGPIYMLDLLLV